MKILRLIIFCGLEIFEIKSVSLNSFRVRDFRGSTYHFDTNPTLWHFTILITFVSWWRVFRNWGPGCFESWGVLFFEVNLNRPGHHLVLTGWNLFQLMVSTMVSQQFTWTLFNRQILPLRKSSTIMYRS